MIRGNWDEEMTTKERERRSVTKVAERQAAESAKRAAGRRLRSPVQEPRDSPEARTQFVKRVQSYLEVPRG